MRASDEALMDAYARGDPDAFDELFRRYGSRAHGFFLRRTRCPERAADLLQELFLKLHRARRSFLPERRFEPWFFQIARNLLVDERRRRGPVLELLVEELHASASARDPEHEAASREALGQALAVLSPDDRFLVSAAKGTGVGSREIARVLGRTPDAVRQSTSRALRRLRGAAQAAMLGGKPA